MTGDTNAVHASLAAFLHRQHGDEHLDVILAALTFELARLIGVAALKGDAPNQEIDDLITRVAASLRDQVTQYRAAGTSE